jgi:phosphoribosyl-dephospho-CoA transferase
MFTTLVKSINGTNNKDRKYDQWLAKFGVHMVSITMQKWGGMTENIWQQKRIVTSSIKGV